MPIYSSEFCAFFLVIRHEIYVYLWTSVLLYEKQQAFQFADRPKIQISSYAFQEKKLWKSMIISPKVMTSLYFLRVIY